MIAIRPDLIRNLSQYKNIALSLTNSFDVVEIDQHIMFISIINYHCWCI